jgi:hypothetical protein
MGCVTFDARSGMLVDSVEMTETNYNETREWPRLS